jgi:hypothetical protein
MRNTKMVVGLVWKKIIMVLAACCSFCLLSLKDVGDLVFK